MTFAYLTSDELREVQQAAIDLGFADTDQSAALTATISRAFVATATQGGTPLAKLMTLTARMNTTRALVSGQVPLREWLGAAIPMAGGQPEEMVFRRALERMSADGRAGTKTSPGDDPVPMVVDVEDLPRSDGELEVVIFEDDTLDVAFLHTGTDVSRSVAKLVVHRHFDGVPATLAGNAPDIGHGSGWMIAPTLLITNNHVVNARVGSEPDASAADFDLQGKAIRALFDFYTPDATVHTAVSAGCVAHDKALDYAILRLAPDTSPRPPLRLRTSPILKPKDRALRERVNVLQHPGGNPMRLGFRNNFVVTGTADRLSYLTDTAGGSSGSPICDDAWFAAALHRGFQTITGGSVSVWGRTINQENYGTPIGKILEHLAANHPDLRAEILAGRQ
ncbi:trypsin-like peptidase domain-containing protein [Actinokineospora sp.]|uniref:trypsin-like peptidase domain-containing protein n=1 Tax=Actinokineospora sp. TaxID=1872133 RepID=UPI003D6B459B